MKTTGEQYAENVETWKDIEGYENIYQVSSLGRVKNIRKISKESLDKYDESSEGWILTTSCGSLGYPYVSFYDGKTPIVSRLVANAFLSKKGKEYRVLHKNGNARDNRLENLFWEKHSDEWKKLHENGTINTKGVNNFNHKLTEEEVLEIVKLIEAGNLTQTEIANKFNIGQYQISKIKNGKAWASVTGIRSQGD